MESDRYTIFTKKKRNPQAMASQLFYHISWPHGGSSSERIVSSVERLSNYPEATKKVVVFDKYIEMSAKDHERMSELMKL